MAIPTLEHFLRKPFRYYLVLTLLALATPYAFAPYYYHFLMPFLFAGLIILTELRPNSRISTAYWFGLVAYTSQFWWIHTALHTVSGLPNIYAIPLTFLLPAFLALFPAIAFWLYEKHHLPRPLALGVMLPLLWTITEFGRERVFTGFGWGALGYSQISEYSPLAAFAPIGGIHLVTLATAALSCWLVLVVRNRFWWQRVIFALAIAGLTYQAQILRSISYTYQQPKEVRVALLQGNIPQHLKFDDEQLLPTYRRYFDLVSKTKAEIVVLPETAFPQYLQHIDKKIIDRFAEKAKENGSALAVGIPAFTEDNKGQLNAMINLANFNPMQPEKLQVYAKNHLVPFGEFKPIPQLTEPLYKQMNMPLSDFKRGGIGQEPFDMAGEKVAMNICYEDGFGDELIESAKKSTLLANASNMAWYGNSNAMWQQLQQSQTRALEMGRYLIRAQNNGASAIIAPNGKVVEYTKPNTTAILEGKVHGMTGETPYMRLGSSWYLFYVMLAVAGVLMSYRPRTKLTPILPTINPNNQSIDKNTFGKSNRQPEKNAPKNESPIDPLTQDKIATHQKSKHDKIEQPVEKPIETIPIPMAQPEMVQRKSVNSFVVDPEKVQQAQASAVMPDSNKIIFTAPDTLDASKQMWRPIAPPHNAEDDIVRQSENKRQNIKPKRKKNKKRK